MMSLLFDRLFQEEKSIKENDNFNKLGDNYTKSSKMKMIAHIGF